MKRNDKIEPIEEKNAEGKPKHHWPFRPNPGLSGSIESGGKANSITADFLTPRQATFAAAVISGSTLADAYRTAFPENAESKWVSVYANKLIKHPKVRQYIELLQQAARMRFLIASPKLAEKMLDLSENADSEKIQFEATKDALNRAGLQPPQRVETIHIGIFGSASQEDIRNLLRKQLENKKEEEE